MMALTELEKTLIVAASRMDDMRKELAQLRPLAALIVAPDGADGPLMSAAIEITGSRDMCLANPKAYHGLKQAIAAARAVIEEARG